MGHPSVLSFSSFVCAIKFNGQLNWGDIGALVAGLAALIGIPLIFSQVRETRRTAQGEALLQLLLRLQEKDTLAAREILYELQATEMTDAQLLALAPQVEPHRHADLLKEVEAVSIH
jgi:hypothetical protein